MRFSLALLTTAGIAAAVTPTAAQSTYAVMGTRPSQVVLADPDADGDLEIVTLNEGTNSLTALESAGDGTFGSPFVLSFPSGFTFRAIAGGSQAWSFHGSTAGGGVQNFVSLPLSSQFGANCFCPSGPGKLAISPSNRWAVALRGTPLAPGSIHYAGPSQTATLAAMQYVDVCFSDVDNDGQHDLIALSKAAPVSAGDEIQIFLAGPGGGYFAPNAIVSTANRGTSEAMWCGDLDGDGVEDDFAVTNPTSFPTFTNELFFVIDALAVTPTTFSVPVPGSFGIDVEIADFDNSGLLDAIVVNAGSGDVVVLHDLDVAGQAFASASTLAAGTNPVGVAVGDLNGDTVPDAVVVNQGSDDVTVSIGGPTAVVQPYGAGCPGTGGLVPAIGATGFPVLGNSTFSVDLSDGLGMAPHLLFVGPSSASVPLGATGCTALVQLGFSVYNGLTTATGTATVPLPIPNDPATLGLELYFQWAVFDAQGAFNNLAALSDGLQFRVGTK